MSARPKMAFVRPGGLSIDRLATQRIGSQNQIHAATNNKNRPATPRVGMKLRNIVKSISVSSVRMKSSISFFLLSGLFAFTSTLLFRYRLFRPGGRLAVEIIIKISSGHRCHSHSINTRCRQTASPRSKLLSEPACNFRMLGQQVCFLAGVGIQIIEILPLITAPNQFPSALTNGRLRCPPPEKPLMRSR